VVALVRRRPIPPPAYPWGKFIKHSEFTPPIINQGGGKNNPFSLILVFLGSPRDTSIPSYFQFTRCFSGFLYIYIMKCLATHKYDTAVFSGRKE